MLTTENSGALVEPRKNKGAEKMANVKIKVTVPTMINGRVADVGATPSVDERLAKDLMRRGRAVPATPQTKGTGPTDKGEDGEK